MNQKALDLADVNAATKDPSGGKILRTANGAPAGVLIDRAQELVSRRIPAATDAKDRHAVRGGSQEYVAERGLVNAPASDSPPFTTPESPPPTSSPTVS